MDELNVTYSAIDSNSELSEPLKENFKDLITVFHQNFRDIDLSNFNERVKGLTIKKGNKYLVKDSIEYKARENVLYLNKEELEKNDARHDLMYAILTIITSKENGYGIDFDGKLRVLNVGLTEMITNFLVGNECD